MRMLAIDVMKKWINGVNTRDVDTVVAMYHAQGSLLPTFSPHALRTPPQIREYFEQLRTRTGLQVTLHEHTVDVLNIVDDMHVLSGVYSFQFEVDDELLTFPSRFTFVLKLSADAPIMHHHSSQIPRALS